jgi:hypothetical protein
MFLGILDTNSDSFVKGTYPRMRIRTKISRISYSGKKSWFFAKFFLTCTSNGLDTKPESEPELEPEP